MAGEKKARQRRVEEGHEELVEYGVNVFILFEFLRLSICEWEEKGVCREGGEKAQGHSYYPRIGVDAQPPPYASRPAEATAGNNASGEALHAK